MQPIALNRLRKELADLEGDPAPGITCYPVDDSNIAQLEAYIIGPPDTPYENGTFQLAINVPDNYPFDPPQMRFRTKIYHPNIDESGRICADMLKTGEAGAWKPSLNLSTLLISLRALLSSPNPDDPLDADIAREYKLDYPRFVIRAKEHTAQYATGDQSTKLIDEDEPPKVWEETQKDEEEETALQEHDQQEMSQSKKSRLSLSSKKRRRVSSPMSQSSTQDNSQNAPTSSVSNHTNMNQLASSSLSSSPPPPSSSSSSSPLLASIYQFTITTIIKEQHQRQDSNP
ncbi:ubiquitin-conjugating enzyme e2 t-like [Lichtheimia corymbifera JMRC:FSU:9682]|uniref:E2 ubiquitin-conjugating enzyme n=1 Tax=Lichtheimia corymbifera JMRC:FSU:9682 TaxID=1263082 RepID=A0A068S238_9FUNG|nr:ubiquitin-conjugating enzyme e2 t-like [Lichtheimia corymbifera JMRC:FSU:9682]